MKFRPPLQFQLLRCHVIVFDQSDTSFAICSQPFHYSLPEVNFKDWNRFFRSFGTLKFITSPAALHSNVTPATQVTGCKFSILTVLKKLTRWPLNHQLKEKNWHRRMMLVQRRAERNWKLLGISNIPLLGVLYWRFNFIMKMRVNILFITILKG